MDDLTAYKNMIADKRKAYKKIKLSLSTSDINSYVDLKRTCKKEIRRRKTEYDVWLSNEAKKKSHNVL